jgi:hypothetical protein
MGTGLAVVVSQLGETRRSPQAIAAAAAELQQRLPYPLSKLAERYAGEGEWDRAAPPILTP